MSIAPIKHASFRSLRSAAGVTLIELMVGMALGIVVVWVIGYAYLASKQAFRTQDVLSRMQENARFVFETLGYDLRQAGSPGCYFDAAKSSNGLSSATQALWYGYPFNTTTPLITGVEIVGYDDARNNSNTPTTDYLKDSSTGILRGDGLAVVGVDTLNEYKTTAITSPGGTFGLNGTSISKHGTLIANRPVVARDCQNHLTFVGQSSAANSIPTTGMLHTFAANSRIFPLDANFYHIRSNVHGEPALFRQRLGVGTATAGLATTCKPPVSPNSGGACTYPEELVEGVEDMQITYGVDTSATADGAVDAYGTATQISAGSVTTPAGAAQAIPGANSADYWKRVLAIRVNLLMVSRSDESITTQAQRYTFNGTTTTPTDRRLRKVFSTTLAIRNRLP